MGLSFAWTEQELLQTLQQNTAGTLVVTSTVRAARALRARYNRVQAETSRTGWVSPQILAWDPWLHSLWNAAILSGVETRILLSPIQELHLWQTILKHDETAQQTLSVAGLAELAQHSFRELMSYRIPLAQLSGDSSPDTLAFHRWCAALLAECRRLSCLTAAQMEAALPGVIESGCLKLPEEILLVGFDRTTPSQQSLVAALQARNCRVRSVELRCLVGTASPPSIVFARTADEEIVCAAQWIRRELLSRPAQRIGVLLSSSAEMHDRIDGAFRAILAPSMMDVRAPQSLLPYEFSLGSPMIRLQPVRTALTLLRWLHQPISADEISWLLVHGGFGLESRDSRAMLDLRFRERSSQLGAPVSFAAFLKWFTQVGANFTGQEESSSLRRTFHALAAKLRSNALERLRSFAEWRELIDDLLSAAEFQLLTSPHSEDYQLLQRWSEMLNNLSSLNAVAGPVRFASALEKLDQLASNTLFSLESQDAPVQVLGIPESAGMVFDAVWWIDAQSSVWPPRGKIPPFIPWALQRAAHMPYADATDDNLYAQHVTRRILDSASNVVISCALQNSDPTAASLRNPDREIILSPLVRQALPEVSMISATEFISIPEKAASETRTNLLEPMHEEPSVPLLANGVRGGVRFLELQSACPFRAFAESRLGARPMRKEDTGLDAATQGTLVHRVLQKFWDEVGSQRNLLQSTPTQHRQLLRRHIHAVLADYFLNASELWQTTLLEIESQRIEERLLLWLEREKERPEFSVVATEDTLQQAQLGGIEFQCRVDRIDATQRGHVLLDYKTGCVNANDCAGDRPEQPQLPAYATLRHKISAASLPIAGIAFAGLHPRKVAFTVIAAQTSVLTKQIGKGRKGARSDRSAMSAEEIQLQLENWETVLTRLAQEFRSGRAVVDPKKGRDTCANCQQSVLCRVGEAEAASASVGEEDRNPSTHDLDDFHDN